MRKELTSGIDSVVGLPANGSQMISVIICTYNRANSLRNTLKSLQELSVPANLSWELIVVDNNCIDDTREVVEKFSESSGLHVRYLFEGNQGLAHARNLGIKEAKGGIIAFTDDDVTVDPHWLRYLKSAFDADGCIGVAGRIVPVWTCKKPSWLETDGPYRFMKAIPGFDLGEERCEIKTPPFGANMAFKKAAFEKYGLFRTDLGRAGTNLGIGEDTEFGRRLIRAQERLVYAPQALVHHPVERQRTEKRYFQTWYFNYGKSLIRVHGIPKDVTCYFGVPKHLFRSLVVNFVKWTLASNSQLRFYYKLQLCSVAGEIVESSKISRSGR